MATSANRGRILAQTTSLLRQARKVDHQALAFQV